MPQAVAAVGLRQAEVRAWLVRAAQEPGLGRAWAGSRDRRGRRDARRRSRRDARRGSRLVGRHGEHFRLPAACSSLQDLGGQPGQACGWACARVVIRPRVRVRRLTSCTHARCACPLFLGSCGRRCPAGAWAEYSVAEYAIFVAVVRVPGPLREAKAMQPSRARATLLVHACGSARVSVPQQAPGHSAGPQVPCSSCCRALSRSSGPRDSRPPHAGLAWHLAGAGGADGLPHQARRGVIRSEGRGDR